MMKKISFVTVVLVALILVGCNNESYALTRDAGKARDQFFSQNAKIYAEGATCIDYPRAVTELRNAADNLHRGRNVVIVRLSDDRFAALDIWVNLDPEGRDTYKAMLAEQMAYELLCMFNEPTAAADQEIEIASIEVK